VFEKPELTIRFVMADFYFQDILMRELCRRRDLTEDQGTEILKGYETVMHPVKPLVRDDGLAGFYVQAADPWKQTRRTSHQIRQHGMGWLDEAERDLKDRYERDVRGQAADFYSPNKPEPGVSVWQRIYDADPYNV
jgi:hypothetical protein